MKVLLKEAFYPSSPDDVWVAITDRHALAEWLMPNDFEPIVGHRFRFQIDPMPGCNTLTQCEVLEVDRPRKLVYSWLPVPKDSKAPLPQPSIVTWTLNAERGGTRLVLEHRGLEIIPWWQRLMMNFGWGTILKRWIRKMLANVHDGRFMPGVIPLHKRCYKCKTIPEHLTR